MNQNKALTILLFAFLVTACTRATPTEQGQTPGQQSEEIAVVECEAVPWFVFPAGGKKTDPLQPNEVKLGQFSVCTTPAACAVSNLKTLDQLTQEYCKERQGKNCVKGNCKQLGPTCLAELVSEGPTTVSIANTSSATSSLCTKPGEQLCSADLVLAANQQIRCRCKCANQKQ